MSTVSRCGTTVDMTRTLPGVTEDMAREVGRMASAELSQILSDIDDIRTLPAGADLAVIYVEAIHRALSEFLSKANAEAR